MKQACVLNREQALSEKTTGVRLIWDRELISVPWVCEGLHIPQESIRVLMALAIFRKDKWIGSLIFHDGYASKDVWWTIYTKDKRWCQRHILRRMFQAAFRDLGCRRIGLIVSVNNKASLQLVRRLGFTQEGHLRQIGDAGEDCLVFGMLANECRWYRKQSTGTENYQGENL